MSKAKTLRLLVGAGQASPQPPVGTALGQAGVKIMDFCNQFNAETAKIIQGVPIPVEVKVNEDRTFSFTTKPPTSMFLLKKAAGVEKGASNPGTEIAGTVTLKQIYEIALVKNTSPVVPLRSVCKSLIGTAHSMGFRVVRDPPYEG